MALALDSTALPLRRTGAVNSARPASPQSALTINSLKLSTDFGIGMEQFEIPFEAVVDG